MFPSAFLGGWYGPNRLWLEGPEAERSEGTLSVEPRSLTYSWSFRGTGHSGRIELFGPAGALRAEWKDSFHAATGMTLHGLMVDGVVRLYGTYPAGEGPDWGWRIELDFRDPEHVTLRMFNLFPDGNVVPAVDLRAGRADG